LPPVSGKNFSRIAAMSIATTPATPYYAVIFTSLLSEPNTAYGDMADAMVALAAQQPVFLGIESARESVGITVSYWDGLEAIAAWKKNAAHLVAQQSGRENWYAAYRLRICRVEREYGV
jgi:heme-degrading monooxygenase HmoA